jgi:inner membrane protein
MFNTTHTLVGIAIARAVPAGWVRRATVTAVIASNLPDIDIITGFIDTPAYIAYHRGITHTLVGVPILTLLLTFAMYAFSRNFWRTFVIAFVAMATHPALDYTNTYGLRPFMPFQNTWYYGDILFIIDPYLDGILGLGVLTGSRLMGSRRLSAIAAITLALAYIGVRVQLRNLARTELAAATSSVRHSERSAVMPHILYPKLWYGVVETPTEVLAVWIDAFRGLEGDINHTARGASSRIVTQAATARAAQVFVGFARFSIVRVQKAESGYRVTFIDFRFYNRATRTSLAAEVILDPTLNVVSDRMGFNRSVDLDIEPEQ